MSEPVDASADQTMRRAWIEDAKFLWYIQEYLLQTYRTYLIVLHTLLVGIAAALIGVLHGQIGKIRGLLNPKCTPTHPGVDIDSLFPFLIELTLLIVIVFFAFWSLARLKEIIDNRAANVSISQQLITELQKDGLFKAVFEKDEAADFKNVSLNLAFKMAELPLFKNNPFQLAVGPYESQLGRYLFKLKEEYFRLDVRHDTTRFTLARIIRAMFFVIWILVSVFCVGVSLRSLFTC